MSAERAVWLLGGPDAGKTNYLTRCWLALRDRQGAIESAGLPDDAEYLNTASMELAAGQFVGHTPRGVNVRNAIPIRSRLASAPLSGVLVIPDCDGEEWLAIHKMRQWSGEWEDRLPALAGCLIFLRAGSSHVIAPLDWVGCFKLFQAPISLKDQGEPGSDFQMPTQVVVIDWLQCVREALRERQPSLQKLRVGIVVAAWDRVPLEQKESAPSNYISANFSLLSQFMETNGSEFEFAKFGVSIAGEDFAQDPNFRQTYQSGRPTDFGYVIHELGGSVGRSRDHTLPVAWALGLDVTSALAAGGHSP